MNTGLNQSNIIGNIVRDATLDKVNVNGVMTSRCMFSVAVNETRSNGEEIVTYFDVTLWREYAENTAQWLVRARQVHVTGAVRLHTYTKNGTTRSSLQIHDATVTLLGNKPDIKVGNIADFEEDDLPFSD